MTLKKKKINPAQEESPVIHRISGGDGSIAFTSLGVEIKISPKAKVSLYGPGVKHEHFIPVAEILIGIGNDHTAHLLLSQEALEALKAGEKIDITTLKEFKKQIK